MAYGHLRDAYGASPQADVAVDPSPSDCGAVGPSAAATRYGTDVVTFEEWLEEYSRKHNEDLEGEDLQIARAAWTAGYRQHASDLNRALQNIKDEWNKSE